METAEEFIKRKQEEFEKNRGKVSVGMKDIGREGSFGYMKDAWTFMVQSSLPEKVFIFERLKLGKINGNVVHKRTDMLGNIEYRICYYMIGKIGRAKGKWIWGQFCPLIPEKDLKKLIEKAKKEKTII